METIVKDKQLKEVSVKPKMKSKTTTFCSIDMTTDYSKFKHIGSNRKINALNYSKLLKSMKEEQLIIPICVNEKYEIIDGQHRFKVCKELGLPVYYYMLEGYTSEQMQRANLVSVNWDKDDFLHAFVNEDIESYVNFDDMKVRYGLSTPDLIKIIARIQGNTFVALGQSFEEGNLILSTSDMEQVNTFLNALEDFNSFKEYKRAKFISAFLEMYFFNGYNHKQMQNRLKTRAVVLTPQMTKDDYILILSNKIYSFGGIKNNIYYDVDRKKMYSLD